MIDKSGADHRVIIKADHQGGRLKHQGRSSGQDKQVPTRTKEPQYNC
jgi:hypothetical protein